MDDSFIVLYWTWYYKKTITAYILILLQKNHCFGWWSKTTIIFQKTVNFEM